MVLKRLSDCKEIWLKVGESIIVQKMFLKILLSGRESLQNNRSVVSSGTFLKALCG